MASQTTSRVLLALLGANIGLAGYTQYTTSTLLERNYEEAEARMDELEGTLRGHIGLIEDSLKRIENKLAGKEVKGGWGQGMSEEGEKMYAERGRDSKKK